MTVAEKETKETGGVRVEEKERGTTHGETEVYLTGIERRAMTKTIETGKEAGTRITKTEKGRENQGSGIEITGIFMLCRVNTIMLRIYLAGIGYLYV